MTYRQALFHSLSECAVGRLCHQKQTCVRGCESPNCVFGREMDKRTRIRLSRCLQTRFVSDFLSRLLNGIRRSVQLAVVT